VNMVNESRAVKDIQKYDGVFPSSTFRHPWF
jgi:hypothetical protein